MAAIKHFYGKVFDWSFTDYGPDYISFSDDNLDGGFYKADLSSRRDNGAGLVVFYSENLEQTLEKIIQADGRIVEPIFDFPGGRRFHFHDPNGNEFAVWSDKDTV